METSIKKREYTKKYLSNILESITTGLVVIDLKGKINCFNKAAEEITGLISEEVINKNFDTVFGNDNCLCNLKLDSRLLMGIHVNTDAWTVSFSKGEDILQLNLSISPVITSLGERVGTALSLKDITRLNQRNEQAYRVKHLTSMGEMAARMAHKIRNPLGSIELFSSILKQELHDSMELKKIPEYIISGVASINDVISKVLMFVKPQEESRFQIMDIHDAIRDSLFFSGHLIKSNNSIEVVTNYFPKPLWISGDPELLETVNLNIILNAIQAMPKGGKLTISSKKVKSKHKNSSFAEIRFGDTGIGIPETNKSKIFDPLFTTKEKSSGMGLPIVHNLIKIHGGTIDINSRKGEGTVCVITLPLLKDNMGVN